jgi:outer membrane protein assembly factor BamB
VADAQRNRLLRVAPGSGRVTAQVPVGRTPLRIVAFKGSIWSTDFRAGTVSQVSPTTLRRIATVRVGPQPEGIVAFGANLWVVSRRVLAHVKACGGPQGLAYSAGQLWVGCTNDGELVDIDAQSRKVVRRVTYDAADAVTNAGASLRVTSDDGPSTGALDPRTGKLTANVKLSDAFIGDANADVVAVGDGVWVSSPDEGTLYKPPSS